MYKPIRGESKGGQGLLNTAEADRGGFNTGFNEGAGGSLDCDRQGGIYGKGCLYNNTENCKCVMSTFDLSGT